MLTMGIRALARRARTVGEATTGQQRKAGLVGRRLADTASAVVFVVIFVGAVIYLSATGPSIGLPKTATTTKSIVQTVTNADGVTQRTNTLEKTTANVVPSVWQSILGRDTTFVILLALSLLAAFVLAAIVQRVLLGHYAFTVGPLSMPGITREEVQDALESVSPSAPGIPPAAEVPEPVWATVGDPNLALAGWRIDLEKELRGLARAYDLPLREIQSPRRTIALLSQNGVIDRQADDGLQRLLTLANAGVHGAEVDPSVVNLLRDDGIRLLQYLRSLRGQADAVASELNPDTSPS